MRENQRVRTMLWIVLLATAVVVFIAMTATTTDAVATNANQGTTACAYLCGGNSATISETQCAYQCDSRMDG